ncbi:GNAT family N-acetyltransferase [Propionispora hippei]|uniref:Hemolysin n=1 Tax=Propionispora hippei DSM 15287 TaxID=1123003 RepID=A0A1M6A7B5_9FIRM|nr:GNAT family N-acetyltransferase [Propionispora hippei]SHI32362.1 Putative hemolysin [Propionispora hippei DSM 15287]
MELREGKYLLKLAETPAEKDQIYLLRYRVYCQELNFSGKKYEYANTNREYDYFDQLCDHLIIRDEENDCCGGTFRFLPGSRLASRETFYSEQWFDIGVLRKQRSRILELGRACIDAQYRNTVVFKLLFSGVAAYLRLYPHDYLIGLTTLPGNAKNDIGLISHYLAATAAINTDWGIKPKRRHLLPVTQDTLAPAGANQRKVIKKMSTLMFAYYKYGASFSSEPSVDMDFDPPVFDFFTVIDAQKIPAWA